MEPTVFTGIWAALTLNLFVPKLLYVSQSNETTAHLRLKWPIPSGFSPSFKKHLIYILDAVFNFAEEGYSILTETSHSLRF